MPKHLTLLPSLLDLQKQCEVETNLPLHQKLHESRLIEDATKEFLVDLQNRTGKAKDIFIKHNENLEILLNSGDISNEQMENLVISFKNFVMNLSNFIDNGIQNLGQIHQTKNDAESEQNFNGDSCTDGNDEKSELKVENNAILNRKQSFVEKYTQTCGEFLDIGSSQNVQEEETYIKSSIKTKQYHYQSTENSQPIYLKSPSQTLPVSKSHRDISKTQDISLIEAKLSSSETKLLQRINNVRNVFAKNINDLNKSNVRKLSPSRIGFFGAAKKSISETWSSKYKDPKTKEKLTSMQVQNLFKKDEGVGGS